MNKQSVLYPSVPASEPQTETQIERASLKAKIAECKSKISDIENKIDDLEWQKNTQEDKLEELEDMLNELDEVVVVDEQAERESERQHALLSFVYGNVKQIDCSDWWTRVHGLHPKDYHPIVPAATPSDATATATNGGDHDA